VGGGLKRKRLLLTNLIAEMDAKLKRLQVAQTCDAALAPINEARYAKDVQEKYDFTRRKADPNTYRE
jgi:hypothetical protein